MSATDSETIVPSTGFALPSWLAAGAAVVSAVAYAAAFPPDRVPLLGWVALVPFFCALESRSARSRVLLGLLWSCVMTAIVGACLPRAIETYYEQPAWVGWTFLAGAVSRPPCRSMSCSRSRTVPSRVGPRGRRPCSSPPGGRRPSIFAWLCLR